MSVIPNLDFSAWSSGSDQSRQEFVAALGKAYTDIGFVTIKNHGFDEQTQSLLYAQVASFFALESKLKRQ